MARLKENLEELQDLAKERTVKTQSLELDLESVVKRIDKGIFKLDPDYQRRHRWDDQTASRLIESLILNIPVPTVFMSEDIDPDEEKEGARFSIIDGQQRLTAIHDFLTNKLKLTGLKILDALDGCYSKDLPPFLVRRLEDRTMRFLRIDSTLDRQVKFDIFERLNSGSVKLTAQELRNCVQRGPFNELCKNLSEYPDFRALLQIPADKPEDHHRVKTMQDVEIVVRFYALSDDRYKKFKDFDDGFKEFLDEAVEEGNRLAEKDGKFIKNFSDRFTKCISVIKAQLSETAFARYKQDQDQFASRFNVSVYDAITVAVNDCVDLDNPSFPANFNQKIRDLSNNPDFISFISEGTNAYSSIAGRISLVKEIFG